MKGSNFLKVTGILMIIGGALSIILCIIAIAGVALLLAALGSEASPGLLYASLILALVGSVAELIAGIIGVKNCKNADKAQSCIIWGAIVVGLTVLSSIFGVVGGDKFDVVSLIIGLVITALYISAFAVADTARLIT